MSIDITSYILPGLYTFLFILCVGLVVHFVFTRLEKLLGRATKRTNSTYDDMIYAMYTSISIKALYLLIFTFACILFISLPESIDANIHLVQFAILLFIIANIAIAFFNKVIEIWIEKNSKSQSIQSLGGVTKTAVKIVVWMFGLVILLSNLGIDVTALVAGIGISGIAIGLATQKILADVFSSFVIFLDKNILVGDWVETGEYSGTVEKIGIKTTHVCSAFGEDIIIPNDQIVSSVVFNTRSRKKRRVDFDFNVDGDTPVKKLEQVPNIIAKVAENAPTVTLDRCHLDDFGSGYFVYKVTYHESSATYNEYTLSKGAFNLEVIKTLEKKGIDIVNPRYVHV